jgi:glycosyltransferase involved in cell wall biosynthesis
MRVIVSAPNWRLNGVNVYALNLMRGMRARGVESHLLLTDPDRRDKLAPMDLPADIDVRRLPVPRHADWPTRWQCMIRYLEAQTPCILLPNFDWEHSCVSPVLSSGVSIVGIIHSDDPVRWYRQVAILAPYWDAIVAVSDKIAREFRAQKPELANRLSAIPYGVFIPDEMPYRTFRDDTPLRVVYAGRLAQEQKRVFDLPRIARAAKSNGLPMLLSIIGGGPDEAALREQCQDLVTEGFVRFCGIYTNEQVTRELECSDVLLLTSEYEGLPVILIEAMGRGCIPVVTDIPSGIPELVRHETNGLLFPVGDVAGFAQGLATLQQSPALRQRYSENTYRTVQSGGYRIEDMTERYLQLFERVMDDARTGIFRRPKGTILPPRSLSSKPRARWKRYLPDFLLAPASHVRSLLRRASSKD